jgi:hypothetical protein
MTHVVRQIIVASKIQLLHALHHVSSDANMNKPEGEHAVRTESVLKQGPESCHGPTFGQDPSEDLGEVGVSHWAPVSPYVA